MVDIELPSYEEIAGPGLPSGSPKTEQGDDAPLSSNEVP